MWLLVGLGNPGNQYLFTRHNIGFMALDFLVAKQSPLQKKKEFNSECFKFKIKDQDIIACKPMTFMNLSGESVKPLMDFYKIPPQNLIVVHDDIDQSFGQIKIQKNRGHGGHNGIRSISAQLGTSDYLRIKLGVGRPSHPKMEVADYVLSPFSKTEEPDLQSLLQLSEQATESIIINGFDRAATQFSGKSVI